MNIYKLIASLRQAPATRTIQSEILKHKISTFADDVCWAL